MIRLGRSLTAGLSAFRKKSAVGKREAISRKGRSSWLLNSLIALSMAFAFGQIASTTMTNINETLGSVQTNSGPNAKGAGTKIKPNSAVVMRGGRARLPPEAGSTMAAGVLMAVTLVTALLLLAVTLMAMAEGDLVRADWDFEWLSTLPLPLERLLLARIVARSAGNQMGLFTIAPFLTIVAWEAGHGIVSPILGISLTWILMILAASTQTFCELSFRLQMPPPQLRNIQAAFSVLATLTLMLALSSGMPSKTTFVLGFGQVVPSWALWLPPGLIV